MLMRTSSSFASSEPPERTIVPSLAERWEIADDGLRYVFHLREGLTWSDGRPLTAHDVEFGIKRVLNPDAPGSSVAIYFVLEHGQDFYLRRTDDADAIGHGIKAEAIELGVLGDACGVVFMLLRFCAFAL